MLILSQDRQRVLKFKDITDLYVSYIHGDNTIYCDTNNDSELKLGEYKTKERCKDVLKEITQYYNTLKKDQLNALWYPDSGLSYVYEMPRFS